LTRWIIATDGAAPSSGKHATREMASGVAIAMTHARSISSGMGNSRTNPKKGSEIVPAAIESNSAADERRQHSAAEHTPLFAT
jgi:hypothetical protein